jgi:preprotein translocase subunit SecA
MESWNHEAVEIKECVTLGGETQTKSSITYQIFTCTPNLLDDRNCKKRLKGSSDIYNLKFWF